MNASNETSDDTLKTLCDIAEDIAFSLPGYATTCNSAPRGMATTLYAAVKEVREKYLVADDKNGE